MSADSWPDFICRECKHDYMIDTFVECRCYCHKLIKKQAD